jgi:hypothetical protein
MAPGGALERLDAEILWKSGVIEGKAEGWGRRNRNRRGLFLRLE